jgi:hypothetical protein
MAEIENSIAGGARLSTIAACRLAAQLARVLPGRGCTLGGNFQLFKDRKSVILGV